MSRDRLIKHFFRTFGYIMWQTRSIYGALFSLVVLGGFIVGRVEDLSFGEGLYFALITGLTIGYGDITPVTVIGRVVAVVLGVIGIVLTGMIVATATHALREASEVHRSKQMI